MAIVYVAEYNEPVIRFGEAFPVADTPQAEQTIAIGTASATCADPFGADTYILRVHTDAICSVTIGPLAEDAAQTATADNMRMAAGTTEYFRVIPGDYISVIVNT